MNKNHNKKRNVGIIFELLLRCVSARLIEGNEKSAQSALDIISKYFDKESELYREFRLFNALAKSTVSDTAVAAGILSEAKQAARRFDGKRLDIEKSHLIKEINHGLDDPAFYHRRVSDYTVYATIQTLLNDWRAKDRSDLTRTIQYETKIVDWLLKEKVDDVIEEHVSPDVDALVVKILTEKFNQAYQKVLNDEQKNIVRLYALSMSSDKGEQIKEKLEKLKENTLNEIEQYFLKEDNKILLEKVEAIRKLIVSENIENICDETISRFLVISQLKAELMEVAGE